MKRIMKNIVGIFLIAVLLSGCSPVSSNNFKADAAIKDATEIKNTDNTDNIGEYMKQIDKEMPDFEPYYRIVFAFENLPDGMSSIPFSKVSAMYNEIRETFGYIIIGEQPLSYRGEYIGDTCFVNGYDYYELHKNKNDIKVNNPINVNEKDYEGNEFIETGLKTVMLGEDIFAKFDGSVMEGRNLQQSDFTLKKPTDLIKVVLGSKYKDIYEVGDVLSLTLISKPMKFEVVGFYKPNVCFSMDVEARREINFDYTIVIPHLFFDYEPVGQDEIYQHSFLAGEKLSGCIKIQEKISDIDESTFEEYSNAIKKISDKYEISDLYKLPYRPIGFVWNNLNQE